MAGAAHNPVFAKKVGIPPETAKEFNMADKKSGFLKSAMRAKGPAFEDGGKVSPADKSDSKAQSLIDDMTSKGEETNRRIREEMKPKVPRPRSDKNNPDRGTITTGIPRMAKGGSVRGGGCEKRGTRPAKIY